MVALADGVDQTRRDSQHLESAVGEQAGGLGLDALARRTRPASA
jgi:hypothetical protein